SARRATCVRGSDPHCNSQRLAMPSTDSKRVWRGGYFMRAIDTERWQRKGLAKLMLTKLEYYAAAAGGRRIVGGTVVDNEKMISLARRAGFVISDCVRRGGAA